MKTVVLNNDKKLMNWNEVKKILNEYSRLLFLLKYKTTKDIFYVYTHHLEAIL